MEKEKRQEGVLELEKVQEGQAVKESQLNWKEAAELQKRSQEQAAEG